ncbi:MAG: hypothetical protein ACXVGH_08580 [Mycobacteriales bacterium]
MGAQPPPRVSRFLFWAVGRRVPPEHRPWVAEQLARPDYRRRRMLPLLGWQSLVLVGPLASNLRLSGAPSVLVLAATGGVLALDLVLLSVLLRWRPELSDRERRLLLAYHGVTADGALAPPTSAWDTNPLGRVGTALLAVQVLVLASGVAVVVDVVSARRGCHLPAAAVVLALDDAVGRPGPTAAAPFGDPPSIALPGARLSSARQVDTVFSGVHVLAGYVRDRSGGLLGPAAWRVIDPLSPLNPTTRSSISADDALARAITPTLGYTTAVPADPAVARAGECARAAHRR